MTKRTTATIGRVAAAAGVSRATVSRVMNGAPTVAPELASRVRAAAAALEYEPSLVARSLSLGRTSTVALMVPDLSNPMFQDVLKGLSQAAAPSQTAPAPGRSFLAGVTIDGFDLWRH